MFSISQLGVICAKIEETSLGALMVSMGGRGLKAPSERQGGDACLRRLIPHLRVVVGCRLHVVVQT